MPTAAYEHYSERHGAYSGAYRDHADAQFSVPAVLLRRGEDAPTGLVLRDRAKAELMWNCRPAGWKLRRDVWVDPSMPDVFSAFCENTPPPSI